MKGFIEVTDHNQKILINTSNIVAVMENLIVHTGYGCNEPLKTYCSETYDEIKTKIVEATQPKMIIQNCASNNGSCIVPIP